MSSRDRVHGDEGLGSVSGVVSSLPAGYTLGETREEDGIKYMLVYNAGGEEAGPGYAVKSVGGGAGKYSATVTTVTESVAGALGVVHHATLTTDTYGWIVRKGHPVKVVASNISLATDALAGLAADGKFITTDTVGNIVAQNIGDAALATATTDAAGSRFFVNFDKVV